MADPTLADVIDRLDRLEALLSQLVEVVKAGATVEPKAQAVVERPPVPAPPPPAPAAPPPAAKSGEPPIIPVAPPRTPMAAPAAAPAAGAARVSNEGVVKEDELAHIVVPGPGGTIEQVLTRVFEAALESNPEDTWAIMTKLTHPSQMVGPRSLEHFKAFNWHKLRRTAATYLRDGNPNSYTIVYTDPPVVTAEVDRVRAFIKASGDRMPVPVGLARDAAQGNAWRITMLSL